MRYTLVASLVLNVVLAIFLLSGNRDQANPRISEPVIPNATTTDESMPARAVPLPSNTDQIRSSDALDGVSANANLEPATDEDRSPEIINALPGLSGYQITYTPPPPTPIHPAKALATEPEDAGWALAQEARILQAIQDAAPAVNSLEVECRTTRCGVVVALPNFDNSYGLDSLHTRDAMEPIGGESQQTRATFFQIHSSLLQHFTGNGLESFEPLWTRNPDGSQFVVFFYQFAR